MNIAIATSLSASTGTGIHTHAVNVTVYSRECYIFHSCVKGTGKQSKVSHLGLLNLITLVKLNEIRRFQSHSAQIMDKGLTCLR